MLTARPVECFNAETGELIESYPSVYAAARAHDSPKGAYTSLMTAIVNCCRGRYKTAYGYKWAYKEE